MKAKAVVSIMRGYTPSYEQLMEDEDAGWWQYQCNATVSNEAVIVWSGVRSHKIVTTGSAAVIRHEIDPPADWHRYDYLSFFFYGDGSGDTVTVRVTDDNGNSFTRTFIIGPADWAYHGLALSSFTKHGFADWRKVAYLGLEFPNTGRTCYIDDIYLQSDEGHVLMASDDVVSLQVQLTEGSYPSASVVLNNKNDLYSYVDVTDEIEIRAGWEHMMWLLFRGNIDVPARKYPPSMISLGSTKGFAKRLDYRETNEESWSVEDAGAIVVELLDAYFSGVFTSDWVHSGVETSIDSDDEAVSSLIGKLATDSGYIWGVDFNKAVYFVDPEDWATYSNLTIESPDDIIDIESRVVDEVINRVYVKGAADTFMAEDVTSQSQYWLREKTFTDESLTTLAAVTARANELLALYKDPFQEIPISLGEVFVVELYDIINVVCGAVLLDDEITVKAVSYSYSSGGLRTKIQGVQKVFSLGDVIADHEKKLAGIE